MHAEKRPLAGTIFVVDLQLCRLTGRHGSPRWTPGRPSKHRVSAVGWQADRHLELKASARPLAGGVWGRGAAGEAERAAEEAARAEYRAIAERRVRLGLLLAEIGGKVGVSISDEEMTQALVARARSFPGQEKQVWDFYRENQNALAELRAPIYEEKVVDHILSVAKVEDRKVTAKELLADDDEPAPAAPAA